MIDLDNQIEYIITAFLQLGKKDCIVIGFQ